ncbi:hypothetical protein [Paenibacillus dakarensis]|uniref:hypothetical protein n=1 Tax=Paenibacillus dakarensis TaxID=1527293 RepID=UPI0006D5868C|nr:hypothetical protein [Paenibacillus dakarensis]
MSVPSSPFIDILAKEISDHMINRGWWVDCTPEKILQLASNVYELQQWRRDVYAQTSKDGFFTLSELPSNPENGQVAWVYHDKFSYQYVYHNNEWVYADARPM